MPDVSGSNFDPHLKGRGLEGDVQECGNYKDIKFTSHTTQVWEKASFNTERGRGVSRFFPSDMYVYIVPCIKLQYKLDANHLSSAYRLLQYVYLGVSPKWTVYKV